MDFKRLSVKEACDILEKYDSYVLLMHSSPDGDTLGSCTALYHMLCEMGKKAYLVYPDKQFPEYLLPFITVPVYSPEQAKKIEAEAAVTVDVASVVQLRDNYGKYRTSIVMMIDHHKSGEAMADGLIEPSAAAVGELIYDISLELTERKRIKGLSVEAAEALYLSISSDTGCFKYSNVTPKTHIIAAELISLGVRHDYINMLCFDSKSPEQIEAEKIIYNNIEILLDGRLVVAALDKKTKKGLKNEYFENAVNIARSVKGAVVSCSIKEKEDNAGEYRVSLRTNGGTVDVSKICEQLGGGGHACAAGCSVTAESIEGAIRIISDKVAEVL